MAEFRPALIPGGKAGLEAEIFLYDTLPGGAGFSSQLADQGVKLFQLALRIMGACPEQCETSCYRCLRSFKNKFEHTFLDRHVGVELLQYLLSGTYNEFNRERIQSSSRLLYHDLVRQSRENVRFALDTDLTVARKAPTAPILAEITPVRKVIVALSGPLTPDHPSDPSLAVLNLHGTPLQLIVKNELLVRSNLPTASRRVLQRLGL